MLELNKLTDIQIQEISEIVLEGVEKSEFERYFIFTNNSIEKATIFILCYRMLSNLSFRIQDESLKSEFRMISSNLWDAYLKLQDYLADIKISRYNSFFIEKKISWIVNGDERIDGLINLFSVLTRRSTLIDMGRTKAFLMEGDSGKEYHKIFSESVKPPEVREDTSAIAMDKQAENETEGNQTMLPPAETPQQPKEDLADIPMLGEEVEEIPPAEESKLAEELTESPKKENF